MNPSDVILRRFASGWRSKAAVPTFNFTAHTKHMVSAEVIDSEDVATFPSLDLSQLSMTKGLDLRQGQTPDRFHH